MRRQWLFLGLVPLILLLGAACGGDDDGDAEGSDPTVAATDAATAASTEAAPTEAAPTEAAPTEAAPTEAAPSALAALDGRTCTGAWTNLTFGSTGSFEVSFAANAAGDGGVATVTLGGNVFGAAGGTVELPYSLEGSDTVIDADGGFLGAVQLSINAGGTVTEAVLDAPPAFGSATSKVTLEDFVLNGATLSVTAQIDFGDGASTAESVVESTCS